MKITRNAWRAPLAAIAILSLSATLTSCAESERDDDKDDTSNSSDSADGESGGGDGGTFVFAASSDPVMLDPAFASDGETFRVARQMFEGLVGVKAGTADPEPLLAESWETSEDGLEYTFKLKEGVKFHDDTDFDAEAVCANFDRWYNWEGLNQNENISYYYGSLFKGFKNNSNEDLGDPLYKGCEATDDSTAKISLNEPFAAFIATMTLPAFAMQSPAAMKEHNADNTTGDASDPRFSEYATNHPTGTGPFKFDSWERGQKVTLERFDDYWGDKAQLDKVIVTVIPDGQARRQALQNGEVDGYDLVAPGDLEGLKDEGFTIMARDPFTILYLGMNQANPALAKAEVRQAIAHAIDKKAVASQSLPADTELANQFMPSTVSGYSDGVLEYEYDPEKAKDLLKAAGEENLTLKFNYPTGVSRPYMPSPEDTYVAIKAQLEAVGITVEDVPNKWSPDYLDKVQGTKDHDLHLLGWTGDYNNADNFLGVFFGEKGNEWGFDSPEIFKELSDARQLPTAEEQKPAYEHASEEVMQLLPGVPLAHPVPSLAFNAKVKGFEPSPVQDEVWNHVTIED